MASAPSNNSNSQHNIPPGIVELNVGGVFYSTSVSTLTSESGSKLSKLFGPEAKDEILKDSKVNICYTKFFVKPINRIFKKNQNKFPFPFPVFQFFYTDTVYG